MEMNKQTNKKRIKKIQKILLTDSFLETREKSKPKVKEKKI